MIDMNKKLLVFIFLLFLIQSIFGQKDISKSIDSLYKEDQFYIGVTYNLLNKKPNNFSQNGFSSGIHLGFIKDMPINKNRNVALGLGLGYSLNAFNQNLLINKSNLEGASYSILENDKTFTKNTFSNHLVELPFEFRWRTSNAEKYEFWRIYIGFKLSYLISSRSKYRGDLGHLKFNNIDGFNNFQYGITLSTGYNTWNIFMYYGLNPIFSNDVRLNGNSIDMNVIKVGLMFYIL